MTRMERTPTEVSRLGHAEEMKCDISSYPRRTIKALGGLTFLE